MDFGAVSASDRPCSLGPPRLSQPGGGVWTRGVQIGAKAQDPGLPGQGRAALQGNPSNILGISLE